MPPPDDEAPTESLALALVELQIVKDELLAMHERMKILERRERTVANDQLTHLDMRDFNQRMTILEGRVAKIELLLHPTIQKEIL